MTRIDPILFEVGTIFVQKTSAQAKMAEDDAMVPHGMKEPIGKELRGRFLPFVS